MSKHPDFIIEKVIELQAKGYSYEAIAQKLNLASRNVVAGILYRRNIKKPKQKILLKGEC